MKNKYLFVSGEEWFEGTALSNPVTFCDLKLERFYPELFTVDYDLKLVVGKAPTKAEKSSPIYNDRLERYGNADIGVLKTAAENKPAKNVLLNGFMQEHLDYIAPYIKNTAEVLLLFKCNGIEDLSVLSDFKKLKCVLMFANNKLESLWDMQNNSELKVISFDRVTKIKEVGALAQSSLEYISFDSRDNYGNPKEFLVDDIKVFDEIPSLKHLTLMYKK